ncbi:MAG: alpha/beta hydrolase, partial [Deltaproteobacteria bacterium]|nr:alpha/beta hydrolase [Deltaproteobacteria bacterium]
GAKLPVNPKILKGVQTDFLATAALIIDWCFASDNKALKKESLQLMLQAGPEVVLNDFIACDRFDLSGQIGQIDKPALILSGQEDKMTPPQYARFLNQEIKKSRLQLVPQAGHSLVLEQPRTVIGLIRDFADEVFD